MLCLCHHSKNIGWLLLLLSSFYKQAWWAWRGSYNLWFQGRECCHQEPPAVNLLFNVMCILCCLHWWQIPTWPTLMHHVCSRFPHGVGRDLCCKSASPFPNLDSSTFPLCRFWFLINTLQAKPHLESSSWKLQPAMARKQMFTGLDSFPKVTV